MSERSGRTSAPKPSITLHHDPHRIRSRQGVTHANWLSFTLSSMWFVLERCSSDRRPKRRSLTNSSKTNHLDSIPSWPYHSCSSPNHNSWWFTFYLTSSRCVELFKHPITREWWFLATARLLPTLSMAKHLIRDS